MSQIGSRITRVLATAAVLAAAACAPERSPTAPVLPDDASLAAGGNGNGGGGNAAKVKIKRLQLASTTLTVDGSSALATIDLGNSGVAYQGGVSIVAELAQPAASREAANVPIACAPSGQAGFLPAGNCTMGFPVRASSSGAGTGTYVSGPAVLRVRVVHVANGVTTELATRTIDVSLVVVPPAGPSITLVTLENTTLTIDGAATEYTVTIQNPGPPLQNLSLQGYMVQGGNEFTAGGTALTCNGQPELPTGTCTFTWITYASNDVGGPAPLVAGAALFKLQLLQTVGGTTVLDTETTGVTLVAASPPSITSVTPLFDALMIGGRAESARIVIDNQGPQRSVVSVKGWIVQGIARVPAMNIDVECGVTSPGVLPNGGCTTLAAVTAQAGFTPGLTPGAATLEVQLIQTIGTTPSTLDTERISVTLIAPTPWISAVGIESPIPIGSNVQSFVIVRNVTTTQYPNSGVVVSLTKDGVTSQIASGAPGCGGAGTISSGDCVVAFTINVPTSFSSGAARVEVRLTTNNGAMLLDTRQLDVTLTTASP